MNKETKVHTLAMAQDILEAALTEAAKHNAKQVKAIGVKIGDEHSAESDSLRFCLEAVAKGTIAEGARIEIGLIGDRNPEVPAGEGHLQIELELD